ncbi:MAG: hypothetical protein Q9227_002636 [Pyrenula ochraceoflavens]
MAIPDTTKLSSYASSSTMVRYFCPTCGAYVGNKDAEDWDFATGLLDRTTDVFNRVEIWLEDTRDGGASIWLEEMNGRKPEKHIRGRDTSTLSNEQVKSMSMENVSRSERLPASCHCGGVQFYLRRPGDTPTPDPENGRWWATGDRHNASLDTCDDCRLVTGFELAAWAYCPASDVLCEDGSPFDFDSGTLKHYESSPGISRSFCKQCGATVFFRKASRTRDIVDVAVGLLTPPEGTRGGEWLAWTSLEFPEQATDVNLVKALKNGFDDWLKKNTLKDSQK